MGLGDIITASNIQSPAAYAAPGLSAGIQTIGNMRQQGIQNRQREKQLEMQNQRLGMEQERLGMEERRLEISESKIQPFINYQEAINSAATEGDKVKAMLTLADQTGDPSTRNAALTAAAAYQMANPDSQELTQWQSSITSMIENKLAQEAEGRYELIKMPDGGLELYNTQTQQLKTLKKGNPLGSAGQPSVDLRTFNAIFPNVDVTTPEGRSLFIDFSISQSTARILMERMNNVDIGPDERQAAKIQYDALMNRLALGIPARPIPKSAPEQAPKPKPSADLKPITQEVIEEISKQAKTRQEAEELARQRGYDPNTLAPNVSRVKKPKVEKPPYKPEPYMSTPGFNRGPVVPGQPARVY